MSLQGFSFEAFYLLWLSYPAASERPVLSQVRGLVQTSRLNSIVCDQTGSLHAKVLTINEKRLLKGVKTFKVAHGFKSSENKHHSYHSTCDIPKCLLLKFLQTEMLDSTEVVKGKFVKEVRSVSRVPQSPCSFPAQSIWQGMMPSCIPQ